MYENESELITHNTAWNHIDHIWGRRYHKGIRNNFVTPRVEKRYNEIPFYKISLIVSHSHIFGRKCRIGAANPPIQSSVCTGESATRVPDSTTWIRPAFLTSPVRSTSPRLLRIIAWCDLKAKRIRRGLRPISLAKTRALRQIRPRPKGQMIEEICS